MTTLGAVPATAATVYEIDGRWAEGTPTTVATGDVVSAEWRINLNDDAPAPGNAEVENVNFSIALENGTFSTLPDACLTTGVDPVSSISEDGRTLICNVGTQTEGTAYVLQTAIVADGATGTQLTATGTIDGVADTLEPLEVVNNFGMDILWGTPTQAPAPTASAGYADVPFQWSLAIATNGDPGPDTVTYDLTISAENGSVTDVLGACEPFTAGIAGGHPWSGGDHPEEQTVPFVESCVFEHLGGENYRLTLSGIDYSLANTATQDSAGNPIEPGRTVVASGQINVRVQTTTTTYVNLESNAPTYTSPTGATAEDDASNNTSRNLIAFFGAFVTAWDRAWGGSGGASWDDTYRETVSSSVRAITATGLGVVNRDTESPDAPYGLCTVLDSRYTTFTGVDFFEVNTSNTVIEYYVGNDLLLDGSSASYNPDAFTCGTGGADVGAAGWTTTPPADLSLVKAVRAQIPFASLNPNGNSQMNVYQTIKETTPVGIDIWEWAGIRAGGDWGHFENTTPATQTPDARYPYTSGSERDILRVVSLTPTIEKTSDRTVVRAGVPATFSLNYSLVGQTVEETVDGLQLVDTLPAGMTYVAGSATPEPAISANGSGQQVLTWTLDDVVPNATSTLTYQAVASSDVEPGSVLTNSVTASFGGQQATDTADVAVSTSGYTTIGKTALTPVIPNTTGDGVGNGTWQVTLRSFDPLPQEYTDTIDILPYIGDERGTAFAGDYSLTSVDAVPGATVYYTTAVPASLSDDPADAANGAAGDVTGNTVGWTTEYTADATAVRVIGPALAPGATQQFSVNIATDGVEGGDLLVNRAQGRDGHTELVMRTSSPMTVANYYSAALKKYVLGNDGEWHDANTIEDAPTYRPGEEIPYRIVIENTGQGTLTDLEIVDDLFPEGSFTVDTLAPGDTEEHEFTVTPSLTTNDTVVNNACATAAIPEDSGIAPTINCDPAVVVLDGDPEHAKELVSANPIGDGQWELLYNIDVTNTSVHPTTYSLDDELQFSDQVMVASAEVTSAPDGVTLAEPAWDGEENIRIASNIALAGTDDEGYAPHEYQVTVIANVPLQFDGAGTENDPTACNTDGDEAKNAFTNTTTLTDVRGDTENDWACGEPPSIDIVKTVAEGPTPNEDGSWTVLYDIVATNTGAGDGTYTVTDAMRAGDSVVVNAAEVVTTPEGVTASDEWTGLGAGEDAPENVIAADVVLEGGAAHTYQVEVSLSFANEGTPVVVACGTGDENSALNNTAAIEHNGLTQDSSACINITYITVDKTVASGPTLNADGTYTIGYEIVAENIGDESGVYDVFDQLRFGDGISVRSTEIGGPEGVVLNDAWTGLGDATDAVENLLAGDVPLAGGASHVYTVTVVAEIGADVQASDLACPAPGSGHNGGFANGTLLDHNGIDVIDDVCPQVPPNEAGTPNLPITGAAGIGLGATAAAMLLLAGGLVLYMRRRSALRAESAVFPGEQSVIG